MDAPRIGDTPIGLPMAQKKESSDENNLLAYRSVFKRLLLSYEENIVPSREAFARLFSLCKSVFSAEGMGKTFLYMCVYGAGTALVLQSELRLTEPTVYRVLKQLTTIGVVRAGHKLPAARTSRGGPRPTIWSIEGATPEEVNAAIRTHSKLSSPKYKVAEEVAQTILDEYLSKRRSVEITYKEILVRIKTMKIPFSSGDIADITAECLHERGIRIWR